MSEMVSRVAQAICNAQYTIEGWPAFEKQARAAIEAIREPIQEMIEAGALANAVHDPDHFSSDEIIGAIFDSMINAALRD